MKTADQIEPALRAVGELLQLEGHEFAIVVVGGTSLNLLGLVNRVTTDVDVIAFAHITQSERTLIRPPSHCPRHYSARLKPCRETST